MQRERKPGCAAVRRGNGEDFEPAICSLVQFERELAPCGGESEFSKGSLAAFAKILLKRSHTESFENKTAAISVPLATSSGRRVGVVLTMWCAVQVS